MTLKIIAEKAGVSVSTVSRVINGKSTKAASKEVQENIFKIAREIGYTPNKFAQNLRQKPLSVSSSKILGCIFGRVSSSDNDPFFSILARSIEKEVIKKGYTMKYSFTSSEVSDENKVKGLLRDSHLDGVFVLGRLDKNYYDLIQKECRHMVYAGLNGISPLYDQVIVDGYQAAMTAVHYLYSLGHRNIGYIGEKSNETRYKGYYDALVELDLSPDPINIFMTKLSADNGYTAAKRMLESSSSNATAFFCANDLTAIGVIKALNEYGLLIPQDISVIGIDDIETAQLISPSLTTIQIPLEEMGKVAAKLLLDRMEEGNYLPMKIELPFNLIVRDSTSTYSSKTKGDHYV
ncbi:LacI family DNA-binding transcriptional regulator [Proteiniclasticum sp. C24MP]|uniref:LacI family DNA-binding transcriptional regulator n=1 Tax=Proteiniclasticum sp. C24MP TaxID=3374101 RepID=UPI00375516D0